MLRTFLYTIVPVLCTSASREGAKYLSPTDLNEKLLSSTPLPKWKMRPINTKNRPFRPFPWWPKPGDGRQSQLLVSAKATVANVLVTICPQGMLSIAFAMGAREGLLLPCAFVIAFGILAWYSLVSFARAAALVLSSDDQSTLASVWSRTIPNGRVTTFIPDIASVFLTAGSLLVASAFIGDLVMPLASRVTFLPPLLRKRWALLLTIHVVATLPLCLHVLSSCLGTVSLPGIIGILFAIFVVVKRFLDKSYHLGGQFFGESPLQSEEGLPSLTTTLPRLQTGHGLFVLMNMCSLAYGCHYNGVKYYLELQHRSVPALQTIMAIGIGIAAIIYVAVVIISQLAFGEKTSILFLDNYHLSDSWAAATRVMTGIALVCAYSHIFDALENSLYSLVTLGRKHQTLGTVKRKQLSALVLFLVTIAACFVTGQRIGTAICIVCSVFGSTVMYIIPALINSSLLKMRDRDGRTLVDPFFPGESLFNQGLFAFGVVFTALGSKMFMGAEAVI